ncbi:hypothetical protein [Nocardia wallacei]|uniref:hypothetical protein n=1 Tax=Nocardia wallacei TaxID=480035 RepID=UPI002455BEE1|nr:hypothetical protein [Nocardia wallacei]
MGTPPNPIPPPVINREQELAAGQEMYSKNGEYRMVLRSGRLIVEHVPTGKEVRSWGEDGSGATKVKFEDEVGKADKQQQLQLVDDDGKTVDSELAADKSGGSKGGAWFHDWQDPNNEKKGAQQFVLTNNGELIALKHPIADPAAWDGGRPPNEQVLWYYEPIEHVDARVFEGYDFKIPAGANIKDFPLEFRIPPGVGSPGYRNAVSAFNVQLVDIADQLGKAKPGKPAFLVNLGDLGDDNLAENFYATTLGVGVTQDQANSANLKLNALAGLLKTQEKDFDKLVDKVSNWNLTTYQKMYDRVRKSHVTMKETMATMPLPDFSGTPALSSLSAEQIIELPLYKVMAQAVQGCVDDLTEYTRQIEQLPPALRPPQSDAEKAAAATAAEKTAAEKTAAEKAAAEKAAAERAAAAEKAAAQAQAAQQVAQAQAAQQVAQAQAAQQAAQAQAAETPPADTNTDGAPTVSEDTTQVETLGNEDVGAIDDDLLADSSDTATLSDDSAAEDSIGDGASPRSVTGGATAVPTSPAPPTAAAPAGNGLGDMIGPMMAMNAAQTANQGADDKGDRDRDARDDRRRDRQAAASVATTGAGAPTPPPGVTPPAYAGTPPPVTIPGRMVDFPIGNSTVQVPQPVAEALHRQTQNAGTDAVAAYAGTAGEPTGDHPWATVNDVAHLQSGDVVQWERHSALIVKNENGLNILDNGQLVPLDPNKPPMIEKYGNFTGYSHPTGLDVRSDTGASGATASPPPVVSMAHLSGPPRV